MKLDTRYLQIRDTNLEWLAEAIEEVEDYPNISSTKQDREDVNEDLNHLYALAKAFNDESSLELTDKVNILLKDSNLLKASSILRDAESRKTKIITGKY